MRPGQFHIHHMGRLRDPTTTELASVPIATFQLQIFTVTSYTFLVHSVTEKYDSPQLN